MCPVRARVRYLMRDDQVMIGIDRDLHIVADDAGPAATRGRFGFAPERGMSRGLPMKYRGGMINVRRDLLEHLQHLLPIEGSKFVKPVTLLPGRARLATKPLPTGSATCVKTIGELPASG